MLQSLMKTNHFVTSKELTYMCNNLLRCTIYIYFFCPHLTLCILVNKYLVQASTHYLHLLILSSASEAATVILVFLFKAPFKSVSAIIMQRGSPFNDVPGCSTKKMDRKKTPQNASVRFRRHIVCEKHEMYCTTCSFEEEMLPGVNLNSSVCFTCNLLQN